MFLICFWLNKQILKYVETILFNFQTDFLHYFFLLLIFYVFGVVGNTRDYIENSFCS